MTLMMLMLFTGCDWWETPETQDAQSDTISFSEYEFNDVRAITVRSLHNGAEVTLDDEDTTGNITAFLSTIKGTDRMSSKGYYGGSYEVIIDFFDGTQFGIGFGDDESFNYGLHESDVISRNSDGTYAMYPNRYILDGISIEDVMVFFGQYLDLF